jgi:beta-mannosidase
MMNRVVEELDPGRMFFPTNPSGPVFDLSLRGVQQGQRMDDIHGPWQYVGDPGHYRLFNGSKALFHSEYGCVGTGNLPTILSVAAEKDLFPPHRDHPIWLHHGAWWIHDGPVREYFGEVPNLARFVEASQLLQAEGLRYALEANRRRLPFFAGGMIWQMNEPWPTTSCTSLVDYFGRPKGGYYAMALAYAPVVASLRYESLRVKSTGDAGRCSVSNLTRDTVAARLVARLLDVSGRVFAEKRWDMNMEPYQVTEVGSLPLRSDESSSPITFVQLALHGAESEDAEPIHRNLYFFTAAEPPILAPLLELPESTLQLENQSYDPEKQRGSLRIRNSGQALAFRVRIEAPDPSVVIRYQTPTDSILPEETVPVEFELGGPLGGTLPADYEPALHVRAWNTPPARVPL